MRKQHFRTLYDMETEVTYIVNNSVLEITFEQAVDYGCNELVMDIDCNIIKCFGFTKEDINTYKSFLDNNRHEILLSLVLAV